MVDNNIENFESLLEKSLINDNIVGKVIRGIVLKISGDIVLVDVGLKSEGRVPLSEFALPGEELSLSEGDAIDVFVERLEGGDGDIVLSRERARREEAWKVVEIKSENKEYVDGVITARVKGGYTVDLDGVIAFLPGSQVDVRPIRDASPLMNIKQPFQILKIDRLRGNIVVSRRAILEESRAELRSELMEKIVEGSQLEGIVKNITDYGAFIDLGGIDGLLHVTDISWKRITHPSEILNVGDTIQVQVIRFNQDTQRVSLGMKQLEDDPWDDIHNKYPIGMKIKGIVSNLTDYGAFVELESGVEGLVHVSEMSWVKKNVHPGKIVSTSEEIEIMVLEIDEEKRRISMGLKQCSPNPWQEFAADYKVGDKIKGDIRNITEFGMFIGLPHGIDGMVHASDVSWDSNEADALQDFKKGTETEVVILDIDAEKERVSLGIKQLTADEKGEALSNMKKGMVVTCEVIQINDKNIEVTVDGSVPGYISKADLSIDRSEQRTDRYAEGEKIDAKIVKVERSNKRLKLSIKAYEQDVEKEAIDSYGSVEAGASLGDILGVALQNNDASTPANDAKKDDKKPSSE